MKKPPVKWYTIGGRTLLRCQLYRAPERAAVGDNRADKAVAFQLF
jgi:hypothetical protein